MTSPSTSPRGSRLPLLIALVVVVAIVVVAIVAVFVRGGTASFNPDSPEGIVQSYTRAVMDDDLEAARGYLHPNADNGCYGPEDRYTDTVRVTLVDTVERGNSVVVNVLLSFPGGGGIFGGSEYQSEERFVLERDGERWAIVDAPWRFFICTHFIDDEENS